ILPCGVFTQRAPRSGISSILPMAIQFMSMGLLRCLGKADARHRLELVLVLAGDALRPGVDLGKCLGEDEALVIGLAPFRIAHDLAADLVEADAFGPFV